MSNTLMNEDIKSALEYYDSNQTEVNKIIKKIAYIKHKDNKNITDEIFFYDKNKKLIYKSSYNKEVKVEIKTDKVIYKELNIEDNEIEA